MRRLLASGFFRGLLGLICLEGVVYAVSPIFGLDNAYGVLALFGVIGVLLLLVRWAVGAIKERRLSWGLLTQARKQGKSEELTQLEEGFNRAFQELANKRQGKSIFRPDTASYLPWILIMGPAGSGKSTGLQKSELRFTSLGRRVQGIGGTRDCEWWLSEDAIFLDTAGRYADHAQDHEEWLGFLGLLRRFRPRRPLDAVVLQVGIDDLEHLSPVEVEREALELQRRLNELIERLEVHFPVYLVFSKCDRLDGFVDLFSGLSPVERAKPWGFSLDVQQIKQRSLGDAFAERFQAMVAATLPRATPGLTLSADRDSRAGKLLFPHELGKRLPSLRLFVEVLFESSHHRDQPWLTEVHFVSALQDTLPLPSLRRPEQNAAALLKSSHRSGQESLAYFVPGLFQRVVAQTRDKARPSQRAARRIQLTRLGTLGVCALLCTWSSCHLTQGYIATSEWLHGLSKGGRELIQAGLPAGDVWELPELSAELTNQTKYLQKLALRAGGRLTDDAWQAGERLLRTRSDRAFIRPMRARLEGMLRRAAELGLIPPASPEARGKAYADGYLALKLDFVLGRRKCEGSRPEETVRWASDFVLGAWREQLQAAASELDVDQAEALQVLLARFMAGSEPSVLQLESGLKQRAGKVLKEDSPSDEVLYYLVLANAGLLTREKQLDRELSLFQDPGLPLAYTPEGCGRFVEVMSLDQEWWQCILDKRGQEADPAARAALYKQEYRREHESWLGSLALKKPVTDLGLAVGVMSNVVGPNNSELDTLIQVMAGRKPTRGPREPSSVATPVPGRLSQAWRWLKGAKALSDKVVPQISDLNNPLCVEARSPFRGFEALLSTNANPAQEALKRYRKSVSGEGEQGGLLQRVKGIHSGGDRPGAALEMVKRTLAAEGELALVREARSDLSARLRLYGEAGTSGFEAQLLLIEGGLWQVLVQQAAQGLQNLWTNQVYNAWSDVTRPRITDPGTACEGRIKLLQDRLLPFVEQNLAVFYRDNNYRQPLLKDLGGVSLPLSPDGWSRNNFAIGVVNAALPCPTPAEPPSAGPTTPAQEEPKTALALPVGITILTSGCSTKVKGVRIETPEKRLEWSSSQNRFRPLEGSLQDKAQVLVLLTGDTWKEVAQADSYEALVNRYGRQEPLPSRGDRGLTLAPGGFSCGELVFTLEGVFPPKPPPRPAGPGAPVAPVNRQWERIRLPPSLLTTVGQP